ncbi:3-hydroxyisobutyrate dehydrogenase [Stylonychia lemnae]|uniref:3-hydroxyisobutyrate dehydrogenase n=1 Tax=Stylonychia lemnae TaxID=5949 RepID=A0A078AZI0_STYLE|nr:3-hydroxyisobutyrate dehydrogenase [Stylonychia lemnae]|eukprot:CDW87564.1 3-hydroxyisobutyrate dehydrogenase [Stylonychia lemnae]
MINTRTPERAQNLIEQGATFKSSQEIANESDYIFLMLGHPQEVEDLLLNQNTGILQHMKKGALLIDHSTNKPSFGEKINQIAKQYELRTLDIPVSGAEIGAINGRLVSMVGGEKEDLKQIEEILSCYCIDISYMGKSGCGQHTKMANQMMIANTYIGIVEGLIYANKAGLRLDLMIEILKNGGAGSFLLKNQGYNTIERKFSVGFASDLFIKDVNLCLEEAKNLGLSLPGLAQASQLFMTLSEKGYGNLGPNGLLLIYEELNNTKIEGYEKCTESSCK